MPDHYLARATGWRTARLTLSAYIGEERVYIRQNTDIVAVCRPTAASRGVLYGPAADRAAATAALPDVERLAVARIRWNDMSTTNSPAALWDALIEVQGSEAAWRAINGEVG